MCIHTNGVHTVTQPWALPLICHYAHAMNLLIMQERWAWVTHACATLYPSSIRGTALLVLVPVKAIDCRRGGVLSFLCMRLTQLLQSLEWIHSTQHYSFHAEGESATPTGSEDTCTTLAPDCNSSLALISASGSFWGWEVLPNNKCVPACTHTILHRNGPSWTCVTHANSLDVLQHLHLSAMLLLQGC